MHVERKDPRLLLYHTPGIFLEVSRVKKRIISNRRSPCHLASEVHGYNVLFLLYCNGTLYSAIITSIAAALPSTR
jgi:hypothetical protein